MWRLILAAGVVAVCASGCSRSGGQKTAGPASPPIVQVAGTQYGDFVIGEPITHENLTIFPISSKTPKNDDRYITLDEGLANGSIKVIETGAAEGNAEPAAGEDDENQPNPPAQPPAEPQPPAPADAQRPAGNNPFGCPEDSNESKPPTTPAEEAPAQQAANAPAQEPPQTTGDTLGNDSGNNANDSPFDGAGVGGDVNKVMVLNSSGKPLYLMPGEIITGGNQDRTIGQEIVIDSGDKPVSIDVFCVEHGRWGGRSVASTVSQLSAARDFDSNLSLVTSRTAAVHDLAKDARGGRFVASLGHISKDGRLAVQHANEQTTVWAEVAKQNSKVGNDSESDDFAANYASEDISNAVEPFVKQLMAAGDTQQIVGVAVAVNGKMLSVDVFESTPLFKKFWPKLLKSYSLDAVAAKGDKEAAEKDSGEKPKAISVEDCIAFLKEMEKSKAETVELADGQKIDKRDSTIGASFSYYDPKAAPGLAAPSAGAAGYGGGGGFGGGGLGGGVHTSVLAK